MEQIENISDEDQILELVDINNNDNDNDNDNDKQSHHFSSGKIDKQSHHFSSGKIDKTVKIDRVKAIQIYPYQQEHFKRILSILQNELGYIDVSEYGAGKTHIALAIAASFQMGILPIGPKTVLPNWKKQGKIYGIPIYGTLTYNALRGTKKFGIKHGFLERSEEGFTTTELFEQYAKQGMLIIFDECHHLKNENSQQLEAAHALVKSAARFAQMGYNVRVAALSATPADKKENITSLFKILGIIQSKKLYRYDRSNRSYVSVGLQEAVNKCNKYDPDVTFHILCRPINKTTSKLICHELYKRILKKIVTSSMPSPPIDVQKDIKNLFAIMPEEDVERMKKGALLFASATSYSHELGEIQYSSVNWGDIILSRREIDSAKVNTAVRLAREKLEKYPNCKLALYFTYKRDMKETAKQLTKYKPMIMNGDTKIEDRLDMIEKFQKPDNEYRLIISNPSVGGEGIEFDDKDGRFPRYCFVLPSYMFLDQCQLTGRFRRNGTKSKAVIRFIYSREFPWETSLLNSMAEKSRVARDMILEGNSDMVFPGEYDEEIEKYPGEKEDEDDEIEEDEENEMEDKSEI